LANAQLEGYPPEQQQLIIQRAAQEYQQAYPQEKLNLSNPLPQHPQVWQTDIALAIYQLDSAKLLERPTTPTQPLNPTPVSTPDPQQPSEQEPDPGRRPPGDPFSVPIDPSTRDRELERLLERVGTPIQSPNPLPGPSQPSPTPPFIPDPLSADPQQPQGPNQPIQVPKNPTPVQVPGSESGQTTPGAIEAKEQKAEGSPNPQGPKADGSSPDTSSTSETSEGKAAEGRETTSGGADGLLSPEEFTRRVEGKTRKEVEQDPEAEDTFQKYYKDQENGVIARKDKNSGYPALHIEQDGDRQVIREGHTQGQERLSDPVKMRANFEAHYQRKPHEDNQIHHVVTDATVRNHSLAKEAQSRGAEVFNIDQGENLVDLPATDKAYDVALQDPEQIPIVHFGSHDRWQKHGEELLEQKQTELLNNPQYGGDLKNVPNEVLKETVQTVTQQLQQELRAVGEKIRQQDYQNLPDWIRPNYQFPEKDFPNATDKTFPRLTLQDSINPELAQASLVPLELKSTALIALSEKPAKDLNEAVERLSYDPEVYAKFKELQAISESMPPPPVKQTWKLDEIPSNVLKGSLTSDRDIAYAAAFVNLHQLKNNGQDYTGPVTAFAGHRTYLGKSFAGVEEGSRQQILSNQDSRPIVTVNFATRELTLERPFKEEEKETFSHIAQITAQNLEQQQIAQATQVQQQSIDLGGR
jgi:hypothetical protein